MQWYGEVLSTGSVQRQKESERKSISNWYPAIVQQAVQQQVKTLAEALNMPPEVVELLLDAGPKCFAVRFIFLF